MRFKDENGWNEYVENNQDAYGGECVRYAKAWAELMEPMIDSGKTVAECAKDASREADTSGITGFMYGAAVFMLSHCWEHGEELRLWHNGETQIGTEGDRANETGGVLNPAILNIA